MRVPLPVPNQEDEYLLEKIIVDADLVPDKESTVTVKCLINTRAHCSTVIQDLYFQHIDTDTVLHPPNQLDAYPD